MVTTLSILTTAFSTVLYIQVTSSWISCKFGSDISVYVCKTHLIPLFINSSGFNLSESKLGMFGELIEPTSFRSEYEMKLSLLLLATGVDWIEDRVDGVDGRKLVSLSCDKCRL